MPSKASHNLFLPLYLSGLISHCFPPRYSLNFNHIVSLQGLKHSSPIPASGPLYLLLLHLRCSFSDYLHGSQTHIPQAFYPKVCSASHSLATLPKIAKPTLKTSYVFFLPNLLFLEFTIIFIFYLIYLCIF